MRRRTISQATKMAVVKMERKSATGAAKYNASNPVNCGNSCGSTTGIRYSKGTRNRIWRVKVRNTDLAGWPVAWK